MSVDAGMGESVGGTDTSSFDFGDIDFGDSTGPEISAPESSDTTSATQQGENPAWASLKEKLPREFHSQVDPILREWDTGVQKRFQENAQKYSGFDPLIEKGITPDTINQAMGLVERINSEPLAFFEQMRDLLVQRGLLQDAQQVQNQIDDIKQDEEQQQQATDPRLQEVIDRQNAWDENVREAAAQHARQQAAQRAENQISQEMAFIESRVGQIPEWAKVEILSRAEQMSRQQGRQVPLTEAYKDFQAVRQQMLNIPRPGPNAPRVVPSGGGAPGISRDPEALKTFDGRAARGAEIAARLREQNS